MDGKAKRLGTTIKLNQEINFQNTKFTCSVASCAHHMIQYNVNSAHI